jgi:hypothetical protein
MAYASEIAVMPGEICWSSTVTAVGVQSVSVVPVPSGRSERATITQVDSDAVLIGSPRGRRRDDRAAQLCTELPPTAGGHTAGSGQAVVDDNSCDGLEHLHGLVTGLFTWVARTSTGTQGRPAAGRPGLSATAEQPCGTGRPAKESVRTLPLPQRVTGTERRGKLGFVLKRCAVPRPSAVLELSSIPPPCPPAPVWAR